VSTLTSVTTEIRANGLRHTLQVSGARAHELLTFDEVHTWYERATDAGPATPASGDQRLIKGTSDDFHLLEEFPTIDASKAQRRLDDGARWWVLLDHERAVYSGWTYVGRMPMLGAPQGILLLPPHVAFLEDSVTPPAARGSGFAAAAIDAVTNQLRSEQVASVITKIKLGNRPAERVAARIFRPFATVRIRRHGFSMRVSVAFTDDAQNRWVAAALEAH
jgi:GNAT superfamily N-acetyltransferase